MGWQAVTSLRRFRSVSVSSVSYETVTTVASFPWGLVSVLTCQTMTSVVLLLCDVYRFFSVFVKYGVAILT